MSSYCRMTSFCLVVLLLVYSLGKIAVSAVTSTELGYLSGVTSNIQTQLSSKAPAHDHNPIPVGTENYYFQYGTGLDNPDYLTCWNYNATGTRVLCKVPSSKYVRAESGRMIIPLKIYNNADLEKVLFGAYAQSIECSTSCVFYRAIVLNDGYTYGDAYPTTIPIEHQIFFKKA